MVVVMRISPTAVVGTGMEYSGGILVGIFVVYGIGCSRILTITSLDIITFRTPMIDDLTLFRLCLWSVDPSRTV